MAVEAAGTGNEQRPKQGDPGAALVEEVDVESADYDRRDLLVLTLS